MLTTERSTQISSLFRLLGDPFRIRLLFALAEQEACVCHLEQQLSRRQAYISQQLMSFREAGLLTTRRSGKYIFYSLKDRKLLDVIKRAAEVAGVRSGELERDVVTDDQSECECPQCGSKNNLEQ